MPAANDDAQEQNAAAEERPQDALDPLVETLRAIAGLPADEVDRRVRDALPSAIAQMAESNRRLRDTVQRRAALVSAAAAELRAAADLLPVAGNPAARERTDRLRRAADELEQSLRAPSDGDAARRPAPRAGARSRVLVADDDPDVRTIMAELLQADCDVLSAADGAEAVAIAHDEHPDLILMDLAMPRLDGLQALERVRTDPATTDIPVIFVSARGDDSTKARALDLGAVDYLQKPFSERELRARIERTLRLARAQAALRALAQTDALTGLANLRAFRTRLEDEVKRARRYRTPLTCVMADMDRLKPINDELGHAAGDRAIAAVAAVIRDELRETDFGARYGGDEFVLLLPHTGAEEGRILAERICVRLHETELELSGRRFSIGASFGVACLPDASGHAAAEALVRAADGALYRAKRDGRGRVALAGDVDGGGAEAPHGH